MLIVPSVSVDARGVERAGQGEADLGERGRRRHVGWCAGRRQEHGPSDVPVLRVVGQRVDTGDDAVGEGDLAEVAGGVVAEPDLAAVEEHAANPRRNQLSSDGAGGCRANRADDAALGQERSGEQAVLSRQRVVDARGGRIEEDARHRVDLGQDRVGVGGRRRARAERGAIEDAANQGAVGVQREQRVVDHERAAHGAPRRGAARRRGRGRRARRRRIPQWCVTRS